MYDLASALLVMGIHRCRIVSTERIRFQFEFKGVQIMPQNKKLSRKSREPEVLPDVATEAHGSILADPVAETAPPKASAKRMPKKKASPKDRLETRPPGNLATTLDPSGLEARGFPADPKGDNSSDDENDISHSI
jgi:hypothetical protein